MEIDVFSARRNLHSSAFPSLFYAKETRKNEGK
jgi:hypothetical protein